MNTLEKIFLGVLFTLLCLASPVFAQVKDPDCNRYLRIEQHILDTDRAQELFAVVNTSGTYLARRRFLWIKNLDATAANSVWISTFAVSELVSGVVDTSKSYPIPGGNVQDASFPFPFGANIRLWAHKSINARSKVAVMGCD